MCITSSIFLTFFSPLSFIIPSALVSYLPWHYISRSFSLIFDFSDGQAKRIMMIYDPFNNKRKRERARKENASRHFYTFTKYHLLFILFLFQFYNLLTALGQDGTLRIGVLSASCWIETNAVLEKKRQKLKKKIEKTISVGHMRICSFSPKEIRVHFHF